jgi:hypothetical protein
MSCAELAAYESGQIVPRLDTIERLTAAAGLELNLGPHGARRVARQIDVIAEAVRAERVSEAVGLVAELVAWTRDGVVELDTLAQEPASIGDRRWDALLAGVAELLFTDARRPVPGWASSPSRVLDRPWFVSRLRSLWPEILVTTPAPLAARGVHLSAASLGSV